MSQYIEVGVADEVLVFGCEVATHHREPLAAFAVRHYGALPDKWHGRVGHSFAIPYRNSRKELLPLEVIGRYLEPLFGEALLAPDIPYRVTRFGVGHGLYSDRAIAELFATAPPNLQLPATWLMALGRLRSPRVVLSDPAGHLRETAWLRRLGDHLLATLGAQGGELLSLEGTSNLRIEATLAQVLGFEHRVFVPNRARYGAHAYQAAELAAIARATHAVGIIDSLHRTQPHQIRLFALAAREGLKVSELRD